MNDEFLANVKEMAKLANKELGQNYLVDLTIAKRIVDLLNVDKNDKVLEIGCGLGSLSVFLMDKNCKKLILNDIDQRALDFINTIKKAPYIETINKSALKLDLKPYTKIVSNLPYYLTNDLLEYCLCKSNAKRLLFMCQKEVFERLIIKAKNNEYGPLAILIHHFGDIQKSFLVSRDAFMPKPHIDSLVFFIDKTCDNSINRYQYLQFLKRMFLHRRKTIFNNLSLYLMNKQKAESVLKQCDTSILMRPEQVEPDVYLKIFKCIN